MSDLVPALKRAVRISMARVEDSKRRDVALVWRGYIEALREAAALSDDEHAAIADLLPDLPDDPMADGWKEDGWLASVADNPEGVETLFVDWKKGRVPVRS
jgi:hypothetical protein